MTSPPDKTKFHTSHSYKWERPQSSRTLSQQISVDIPLVLGINSAQFSPRWCLCEPNSTLSLTSFSTVVLKTKTFKRWSDWWWLFHIFWQKTDMLPNKNFTTLVWLMVAFHIFWQKTDLLPFYTSLLQAIDNAVSLALCLQVLSLELLSTSHLPRHKALGD